MKKILTILIAIASLGQNAFAQNTFPSTGAAGIGTTSPDPSSQLEVKSTTKGILVPRMTKNQRDAIASPATGLLIYQTNSTPGFYYYTGVAWVAVSPKGVNKTLSNLSAPTAVNAVIQPNANNSIDMGSSSFSWKDLYVSGIGNLGTAKVGNYSGTPQAGMIRWTGSDFQGYNGTAWISLTAVGPAYSAGSGISISNNIITNTSPDQTVTINSGSGTSVTGTYPNFTVNNTSPDQTVTLNGSGATTVSGIYPNFTISSIDSNTTYSAGSGINISGTTISNSSPSQWTNSGLSISYSGGNVGLGTSSPSELEHISGGNFLVTGVFGSSPPISMSGSGTRMFFEPNKAAFRAGNVGGSNWDNSNIGNYSVALGKDVTASGISSVAMGLGATASGDNAVAIGNSTQASGVNSFCTGYSGFAIGNYSIAAGNGDDAEGDNGVAIGNSNTVLGNGGVAIGTSNANIGASSFGLGSSNIMNADNSFTVGNSNETDGNNSLALGNSAVSQSFEETVIGSNNSTYSPTSSSSWNTNDRLFVVGNGAPNSSRSNALTILKNGNTGIGTSSPSQKLEVSGTTKTNNLQMTSGSASGYLMESDSNGNASWLNPGKLFETSVDSTIKDTSTFGFLEKTMTVSGVNGLVSASTKISVTLNITSPTMTGINIALFAPNGTVITLYGGSQSGANFINTEFSTDATASISTSASPYTGNFSPLDAFTTLYGSGCNGTWTLFIFNTNFFSSPTFNNWSISVVSEQKGDDLGDHIATQNIQLKDFWLSNDGSNTGINVTDDGEVGINTDEHSNELDINGSMAVGSSYIGSSAPSNGAIIQGNVGIGTSSPLLPLDVHGAVSGNSTVAAIFNTTNNNSSTDDGLIVKAGHTNYNSSQQSSLIFLDRPDGTVMGTVSQNGSSSVAYSTTSDQRLKENIRDTKLGLNDLMKIQVSDYNFKDDPIHNQTGYIAQQLYTIFPDAVHAGGDDPKTDPWMVDYGRMTPLLVKSIQQLKFGLDSVKNEISSSSNGGDLKSQVATLTVANAQLQSDNAMMKSQLADILQKLNDLQAAQEACCLNAENNNGKTNMISDAPQLEQNAPNPFDENTTIKYYLPSGEKNARMIVTDLTGNILLHYENLPAGVGTITIHGNELNSGAYQYSLIIDNKKIDSKQMVLTK